MCTFRQKEPAPLLSVVIPVAGESVDIPQLISALSFAKVGASIEFVVVVDGEVRAPMRTWINEAQGNSALVVLAFGGQDPGLARNRGLLAATGNYVCFLDSDDEANVSAYLDLAGRLFVKRASVGVLGFQLKDEVDTARVVESWYPAAGTHCAWTDIQRRAAVWRFVFDRDALLRGEILFPAGGYGEDLLFLSRVFSQYCEVEGLPVLGYTYRVHSGSQLTARHPPTQATVAALEGIREQVALNSSSAAKRTLSSWYSRIALLHYRRIRDTAKLDRRLLGTGLVWAARERWHSWLSRFLELSCWPR